VWPAALAGMSRRACRAAGAGPAAVVGYRASAPRALPAANDAVAAPARRRAGATAAGQLVGGGIFSKPQGPELIAKFPDFSEIAYTQLQFEQAQQEALLHIREQEAQFESAVVNLRADVDSAVEDLDDMDPDAQDFLEERRAATQGLAAALLQMNETKAAVALAVATMIHGNAELAALHLEGYLEESNISLCFRHRLREALDDGVLGMGPESAIKEFATTSSLLGLFHDLMTGCVDHFIESEAQSEALKEMVGPGSQVAELLDSYDEAAAESSVNPLSIEQFSFAMQTAVLVEENRARVAGMLKNARYILTTQKTARTALGRKLQIMDEEPRKDARVKAAQGCMKWLMRQTLDTEKARLYADRDNGKVAAMEAVELKTAEVDALKTQREAAQERYDDARVDLTTAQAHAAANGIIVVVGL
jgi:hypothetical protein